MSVITCPYCGSTEVFRFRRDSDYGGGARYEEVNESTAYVPGKRYHDPDVDVYHCVCCDMYFDPHQAIAKTRVVTIDSIRNRIETLEHDLNWKKQNYTSLCESARKKIMATSDAELAGATRHIEELSNLRSQIKEYELAVSVLERILELDVVTFHTLERRSLIDPPVISGFRGNSAFLSNFHKCPVTFGKFTYQSAEAAFQAQKAKDDASRMKFQNVNSSEAKKLGKTLDLRDNWEDIKLRIMRGIVYAKFTQNKELGILLLNTGNAHLQEANTWGDTFWGTDMDGNGENHLGRILMEVREDIRTNQNAVWPNG